MSSPAGTVICVTGSHRSGTSALTRLLNLAGVYLGDEAELGGAAPDNPAGFWEFGEFKDLNDAILRRLKGSWSHPRGLEEGWQRSPDLVDLKAAARNLIAVHFRNSEIWGWKDPRTSLTLPFWQEILPQQKYVICVRNPLAVTASLKRRNWFPTRHCYDLWYTYTARVLLNTHGRPRVIVHFEDLFADWRAALRRIVETLEIPLTLDLDQMQPEVESFLDPHYWHHRHTREELMESDLDYYSKELYSFLASGFYDADPHNRELFDEILRWSIADRDYETQSGTVAPDAMASLPEDCLDIYRTQLGYSCENCLSLLDVLDRFQQREQAWLQAEAKWRQVLGDSRAQARREVTHLSQTLSALLDQQNSRLLSKTGEVEQLSSEVAAKIKEIEELKLEVAGRDQDLERMRSTIQESEKLNQNLTDEQNKLANQNEARRQELQALSAKLVEADAKLSVAQVEGRRLENKVTKTTKEIQKIHQSRHWRVMCWYWAASDPIRNLMGRVFQGVLPLPSQTRRDRKATVEREQISLVPRSPYSEKRGAKDLPDPSFYDIICFPVIDWEFRFQRPQQLVTQFAKHGRRVFYLRTTFHQRSNSRVLMEELGENTYGVQLSGARDLRIYHDKIDSAVLEDFLDCLALLRRQGRIGEAICLVNLPFWSRLAFAARERWGWKVVYDCMDDHSGFSTNLPTMVEAEEELIERADLVITTARVLYEKAISSARQMLLLPNAVDFVHFHQQPATRQLPDLPWPIIGYFGAISDWFDVEMIERGAVSRPDWQFVLIGSTFGADVSRLQTLPNVHLLGEIPYSELPSYLHRFDVATIPFKLVPLTRATNPVKFYEYLSAGKPVVAVELPELGRYRGYFYPMASAADFVPAVETALREDSPELAQERIQLARQNTWKERYERLRLTISRFDKKAAIIIVSFNNLDYLRQCLESLWEKTLYPEFEVVVVDNASDEEVRKYLRAAAEQEPRLKIVLNEENVGFARANNVGIQAAGACDYVVLLNDDTVVTRGWLSRLIPYLDHTNVELVGPVTNWAGNEARVEVDYEGVEDMDAFAERVALRHAGEYFEIKVLAMYCVVMRRSLLDRIGPLDERFGVGMFEDDDFAKRVWEAGGRVVCAEDVFIHHWGRASFGALEQQVYDRLFRENRHKYEEKWGEAWVPHRARSVSPALVEHPEAG